MISRTNLGWCSKVHEDGEYHMIVRTPGLGHASGFVTFCGLPFFAHLWQWKAIEGETVKRCANCTNQQLMEDLAE